MADVFSKAKRSQVMSRIRSRGNKATELALAKLFRQNQITGWRRHFRVRSAERGTRNNSRTKAAGHSLRTFAVRPDFVFLKARTAIFVDGCFWHGCPRCYGAPKSNRAFWKNKVNRNRERDRLVTRTLRRSGWKVVRIWECALHRQPARCLARVERVLAAAD